MVAAVSGLNGSVGSVDGTGRITEYKRSAPGPCVCLTCGVNFSSTRAPFGTPCRLSRGMVCTNKGNCEAFYGATTHTVFTSHKTRFE